MYIYIYIGKGGKEKHLFFCFHIFVGVYFIYIFWPDLDQIRQENRTGLLQFQRCFSGVLPVLGSPFGATGRAEQYTHQ